MSNGEGGYTLTKLSLFKDNESVDLRTSFVDLTLYESIWEQFMTGSVAVVDSYDLKTMFPLAGNEDIDIEFHTNGIDEHPIIFSGKVYSISNSEEITQHSTGYVLKFCSECMITSARNFVQRGYIDLDSNIVNKVYDRFFKKDKLLNMVPTKGISQYVFGSMNPSQAIAISLKNAVSKNNEYGYLFWEGNKEFNCKPLQYLYQQEVSYEYYYKGANSFSDVTQKGVENFNAIQEYEDVSDFDFFGSITEGALGSKNTSFDLITKEFVSVEYNSVDGYDRKKSLGNYPLKRNDLINKKNEDLISLEIKSSGINNGDRSYYKKMEASTIRKRILVFGDSSVQSGDVCNAYLPIMNALGDEGVDYVSGKFLISEIKHSLSNSQYYQTILLQKDAYEEIS